MHELMTKIIVRARLESSMNSVKSALSMYPGLEGLRQGNELLYKLVTNEVDHDSFLKLGRDYIALEVWSTTSPLKFMRESLLRLVSILAILKGKYSPVFEDLFPYLVMVLAEPQLTYYAGSASHEQRDNSVERILARRLISVLGENNALRSKNDVLEKRLHMLLVALIEAEAANMPLELNAFAAKYQVNSQELKEIIGEVRKSHNMIERDGKIIIPR